MIKIKNADILTAKENLICHQVNCKKVMGGGIAKQVKKAYPEVFEEYVNFSQGKTAQQMLGTAQLVKINNKQAIVNIFSQENYGRDKNVIYTNMGALKNAFTCLHDKMQENEKLTIAIPDGIGSGLANGSRKMIHRIIDTIFQDMEERVVYYRFK